MNITVFFTANAVPSAGLSPTISIWKINGTQEVEDAAMTEIGGGFYVYDFTGYDQGEEYCMVADGGSTLDNEDRYMHGTNANLRLREFAAGRVASL